MVWWVQDRGVVVSERRSAASVGAARGSRAWLGPVACALDGALVSWSGGLVCAN